MIIHDTTHLGHDMILNFIEQSVILILNSICYYTTRPLRVNGRIDLLRPVTAILLPLLFPIMEIQVNHQHPLLSTHIPSSYSSSSSSLLSLDPSLTNKRHVLLWELLVSILLHCTRGIQVKTHEQDVVVKKLCRNWYVLFLYSEGISAIFNVPHHLTTYFYFDALVMCIHIHIYTHLYTYSSFLFKRANVANALVSGVLCVITPAFGMTPLYNPLSEPLSFSPIYEQPILWDFILSCLSTYATSNEQRRGIGTNRVGIVHRGKPTSAHEQEEGESHEPTMRVHPVVRRRALHILRLFVDLGSVQQHVNTGDIILWIKYVMAYEALEMETEVHLVDQVWPTLIELCSVCAADTNDHESSHTTNHVTAWLPALSWAWISALLGRVLYSDHIAIRKFALFRFLSGNTGIAVPPTPPPNDVTTCKALHKEEIFLIKKQLTSKMRTKSGKRKEEIRPAPLYMITPSFVLGCVFRGFDDLGLNAGTGINYEGDDGKIIADDLKRLIESFITNYILALGPYTDKLKDFFRDLFHDNCISKEHTTTKNLVLLFQGTSKVWEKVSYEDLSIPLEVQSWESAVSSLHILLFNGSTTNYQRVNLLRSFAIILSHTTIHNQVIDPLLLLRTLALFDSIKDAHINKSLISWLDRMDSNIVLTMGRSCADSFVAGLLPDVTAFREREIGFAIIFLCSLVAKTSSQISASSVLWPVIEAGLSHDHDQLAANRALILLEGGCSKQSILLPLPQNIDYILSRSTNFIISQIKTISTLYEESIGNATPVRSSACRDIVDNHFAGIIRQCIFFRETFPSYFTTLSPLSVAVVNFFENVKVYSSQPTTLAINFAVCVAYLSLGELQVDGNTLLEYCFNILKLEIHSDNSSRHFKVMRSIFQYSKWATLSLLIPRISISDSNHLHFLEFNECLILKAKDGVSSAPASALYPLFEAVAHAAHIAQSTNLFLVPSTIRFMIQTLTSAIKDNTNNNIKAHMHQIFCRLVFRGQWLFDEYVRWRSGDEDLRILSTFRSFISESTTKPHIAHIILSYMACAWLYSDKNDTTDSGAGLCAIIYRTDICQLLVSKDFNTDSFNTSQKTAVPNTEQRVKTRDKVCVDDIYSTLPEGIHDLSISRGFIMVFLSKLPDVNHGLNSLVLNDLCHFMIRWLLDRITSTTVRGKPNSLLVSGSKEYSEKIRAWQSLCLLSRFITSEIVQEVFQKVFDAMSQNIHGQIRYFIEVFTIRCALSHSVVFREHICRLKSPFLSAQHVSSIMVITGTLLIGERYSTIFRKIYDAREGLPISFHLSFRGKFDINFC